MIYIKCTPLYNFIDDLYFAKMLVLRHLSQRLILSGFRLSVRKWQKIPGGEFIIDIRQKLHCGIADIYQIDQISSITVNDVEYTLE